METAENSTCDTGSDVRLASDEWVTKVGAPQNGDQEKAVEKLECNSLTLIEWCTKRVWKI